MIRSAVLGFAALGWLTLAACSPTPLDAVGVAPTTLTNDMVLHWTFDEGSGDVVYDHSGNRYGGNLGERDGGTWNWITDGRFGGALHVASGGYVSTDPFPPATQDWSVSAWVRLTDSDPTTEQYKTVVSTEIGGKGGWEMNIDRSEPAAPQAEFGYWKGPAPGDYFSVGYPMQFAQWTHIVGVMDYSAVVDSNSRTLTLYVNGDLGDLLQSINPIVAGDSTLFLGTWSGAWSGQGNRYLDADVDDVVIYSRALAASEVFELFQSSPPDLTF
jgi:hypothetical protein